MNVSYTSRFLKEAGVNCCLDVPVGIRCMYLNYRLRHREKEVEGSYQINVILTNLNISYIN